MTLVDRILKVVDETSADPTLDDLTTIAGIGPAKAILIAAALEFARRQIRPEGFKITFPRSAMWPTGSRSIFSAYPSTAPTKWTSSYALYVVLKPEPSKQRASCNALLRRLTGKRWGFQAITNKVSGSLPASKLF